MSNVTGKASPASFSLEAGPFQAGAVYLSQDEGHHIRGLPVAGVEEVGQRDGGEGGERLRAVQRVVNPLGPPPAL